MYVTFVIYKSLKGFASFKLPQTFLMNSSGSLGFLSCDASGINASFAFKRKYIYDAYVIFQNKV